MGMALPLVRMPLPAVYSSRILAPPPGLETSLNLTEDDPIMTIPPECEAQILRYFHVEKWPPTTIARQLNINRGTVKRVLARAGLPPIGLRPRPARIDPYLPFIHQTLEKFPMLAASRLYVMCTSAVTAAAPITSGISSHACDHVQRPKPFCVCALCQASRPRSTGHTSVIS